MTAYPIPGYLYKDTSKLGGNGHNDYFWPLKSVFLPPNKKKWSFSNSSFLPNFWTKVSEIISQIWNTWMAKIVFLFFFSSCFHVPLLLHAAKLFQNKIITKFSFLNYKSIFNIFFRLNIKIETNKIYLLCIMTFSFIC